MKFVANALKPQFKLNKVIVFLTASDVFTWSLMVVVSALTGLYLSERIGFTDNEAIRIVGVGTAVYSLMNGLFQIPIGIFIDKYKGNKDEIALLFLGNTLMGLPLILFPTIRSEYTFYGLQMIIGIGTSINLVSWRKLFAKHVDDDHEGLQYGTYETVMSISIGLFSIMAGILASVSTQYFDLVIVGIGIVMVLSSFWAYMIFRVEYPRNQKRLASKSKKKAIKVKSTSSSSKSSSKKKRLKKTAGKKTKSASTK